MDPRSIRTNNPGAINYGPFAASAGATGTDGRLAVFPNAAAGYAAMEKLLDLYERKHGLNTVAGIISRWAPRGVDNNSTDAYISKVAREVGVDPNAPLGPQHRQALLKSMASYEAGRPVDGPGGQPPQSPAQTPYSPQQPLNLLAAASGQTAQKPAQSNVLDFIRASQTKPFQLEDNTGAAQRVVENYLKMSTRV